MHKMRGSVLYQVDTCITQIDKIGFSKKEFRENNIKAIHSYKTKDEVRKISRQFVNFTRDKFDIKNLHELKQEHYEIFLESKNNTSLGYQRTIETHLNLLQEGLNKYSERNGIETNTFCPGERIIKSATRGENVSNRALDIKKIENIKAESSLNTSNAVELMHGFGLRVEEATTVRVTDIDFQAKSIDILFGKGGRPRTIYFENKHIEKLEEMTKGKDLNDCLVPVSKTAVSNEIKKTANQLGYKNYTGTHSFRHSYARERLDVLMTREEKDLFEKQIKHYKDKKPFDYAIQKDKQELYNSMKSKIDQIHHELGHGNNRFDLALRYMG